jgi:hypothetical protein
LETVPEKSEFAEIALAKAKIKLLRQTSGAISLQVTSVGGSALIQIGVSLDGARLEYWPLRGMNMNPAPEAPMVPVMLVSDKEQFFGRTCPKCKTYFRTVHVAEVLLCPYCSIRAPLIRFTTENQLRFIDEVRKRWVDGFNGNNLEEIDLLQKTYLIIARVGRIRRNFNSIALPARNVITASTFWVSTAVARFVANATRFKWYCHISTPPKRNSNPRTPLLPIYRSPGIARLSGRK